MVMREILEKIEAGNPINLIISDLIKAHRPRALIMQELYEEYKGEVPIKSRVIDDATKCNNKLANDYRGDIIDTITGYLFGLPISYTVDTKRFMQGETVSPRHLMTSEAVEAFKLRNNIEDADGETGKMMSICGYGARLMYINTDGLESLLNVDPWEAIFIYDGTTSQLQYALRYYKVYVINENKVIERYKVEWYDNKYREVYLQVSADRYELVQEETKPHLFDYVPLIEFPNNQERMGDFEKVAPLIDAYDKTMSDAQNEIEEFRMAYLVFKGLVPDAAIIKAARQSGAFGLPDSDMDITFLTKQVSDVLIENHKKTLNENIYKFSKTVDMSAENFSGAAMSGEARKWKLLGLENKAITKERKFTGALINQFKVLVSAWRKKGVDIEPRDIYWEFRRNLPVELSMEAKTTSDLMGKISEETRLSLLSFIDDPKWEIEKMAAEQAMRLQAFTDVAGAGEDDDGEGEGNENNPQPNE